ncbi:MAG: 30S ribosomal protein S4 [Candidatus Komeilibacteria bacterium]
MGRYTGPKVKISRREGTDIFDTPKWNKRNYPPGQHGPARMGFRKGTDYGKQLREKQKAKLTYGLFERQFANLFEKSKNMTGDVGINLMMLLEKRLDNVVYRAGFAKTRRLARQLVTHGHVAINKVKTDIPSYSVKVGQTINVRTSKLKLAYWKNLLEDKKKAKQPTVSWLTVDWDKMTITVTANPLKEELPGNIDTKPIVEFYSR